MNTTCNRNLDKSGAPCVHLVRRDAAVPSCGAADILQLVSVFHRLLLYRFARSPDHAIGTSSSSFERAAGAHSTTTPRQKHALLAAAACQPPGFRRHVISRPLHSLHNRHLARLPRPCTRAIVHFATAATAVVRARPSVAAVSFPSAPNTPSTPTAHTTTRLPRGVPRARVPGLLGAAFIASPPTSRQRHPQMGLRLLSHRRRRTLFQLL